MLRKVTELGGYEKYSVNWYVSQCAWRLNEDKADFDADDGEDDDDDDGDEEFLVVFPVPCSLPSGFRSQRAALLGSMLRMLTMILI